MGIWKALFITIVVAGFISCNKQSKIPSDRYDIIMEGRIENSQSDLERIFRRIKMESEQQGNPEYLKSITDSAHIAVQNIRNCVSFINEVLLPLCSDTTNSSSSVTFSDSTISHFDKLLKQVNTTISLHYKEELSASVMKIHLQILKMNLYANGEKMLKPLLFKSFSKAGTQPVAIVEIPEFSEKKSDTIVVKATPAMLLQRRPDEVLINGKKSKLLSENLILVNNSTLKKGENELEIDAIYREKEQVYGMTLTGKKKIIVE